jgi:hypothetical protein
MVRKFAEDLGGGGILSGEDAGPEMATRPPRRRAGELEDELVLFPRLLRATEAAIDSRQLECVSLRRGFSRTAWR